ncbi:hypothetical protein AB3S75_018937 [Citrus x aurantiifolia]
MGLKMWRKSGGGSGSGGETIKLGRCYSQHQSKEFNSRWRTIWRKITRGEKKKVHQSPVTFQGYYDPDTYSQNFDQGTGSMEPENLYRSFSARYARSSRYSHDHFNLLG